MESSNDVRRKAREQSRKAAAKVVDEQRAATARSAAAAEQRMAQSQPTPTQRENDLAKVGALDIDAKEDDGSGPDNPPRMTRDVAPAAVDSTYRTRAAAPAAAGHTTTAATDRK